VDAKGLTLLHGAVLAKSEALVRLLLARGANPCVRDADGCTPFALARRVQALDSPELQLTAQVGDWRAWARDGGGGGAPPPQSGGAKVFAALEDFLEGLPREAQVAAGFSGVRASLPREHRERGAPCAHPRCPVCVEGGSDGGL
jgi:hypothetical protein